MNNVTFEDLISEVKKYNPDEVEAVTKAHEVAKRLHEGQRRESGEEYITHPVNVAYILASMHADRDTLCAGLLHDTLEDTPATKEDIEKLFNSDVANLVDGVTKINKLNYSCKEDEEYANTRKIIMGITNDARIVIIKLADRLHNMKTLNFKNCDKQKEIALETMKIYVPFAKYLGGYKIKREIEDLSLQYLKPEEYGELKQYYDKFLLDNNGLLVDMSQKIKEELDNKGINNLIELKQKNIYSIYKRLNQGQNIEAIHNMLALKVIVDNVDDCYLSLEPIHRLYNPYNSKFKDYIANPKPNKYQSLHTTLFTGEKLVQAQIRDYNMDLIAQYGLMAYWDLNQGNAKNVMREDLQNKYQFIESLKQFDDTLDDNEEFVNQFLSNKVYVRDFNGDIIVLPYGSNIIDFAFTTDPVAARNMVAAFVNNEYVPFSYVLKNKDKVNILTDNNLMINRDNWEELAQTPYAKKLIKKYK